MANRVAVFIDLANIVGGFDVLKKNMGMPYETKLDFKKLVSALTLGLKVISRNVYVERRTTFMDAETAKKQQGFLYYLAKVGFDVVTRDIKIINTEEGEKVKTNMDVEIAYDMAETIQRGDCNEIILFSGDSDFRYVLMKAKAKNIKTTVVSTKGTLSIELQEQANRLILLDDEDFDIRQFVFHREHREHRERSAA